MVVAVRVVVEVGVGGRDDDGGELAVVVVSHCDIFVTKFHFEKIYIL